MIDMDLWILRIIKSRSCRSLAALTILLVCVGLLLFWQKRYIENFISGPYSISLTELEQIRDVTETARCFVTVSGAKVIDTGMQEISIHKSAGVETSRSTSANYYALVVGENFLIYKKSLDDDSGPALPTTVTGELLPMPYDLEAQLFDTPEMTEIRGRFYSFYLDTDSFRLRGYWAIVGLLVLGIFVLIKGVPAWRYWRDPSAHPACKRIAGWGHPVLISSAVEREWSSPPPRFKGSGWRIKDEYLIQATCFTFDVLRLSDLVWAYKTVTQHTMWFIIPAGKTCAVRLICANGTATIESREKTADQILLYAAQHVPWAVFGFSQELQGYYNKDARGFCAAVAQRKQEVLQSK